MRSTIAAVTDSWGLDGKRLLVTGGASGIGAAVARLAAGDGASVVVVDLPGEAGRSLAEEIGARFASCDVSDPEQWVALAGSLEGLDIAVLNAGVVFRPPEDFMSTPDDPGSWDVEAYQRAVGVNINGVAFGLRALVPVIEAGGGGSITATASLAGLIPWSPDPVYSMTKWAIVGLVRASATPLRAKNITINAICPGFVETDMIDQFSVHAARDMADPLHIAHAHLDAATSGVTGRAIKAVAGRDHQAHEFARVSGSTAG